MPIPRELSTEADQQLRFALLGPPQAWRDEESLELGPVREQALLIALLLRPGRTVGRQQLLDGVWGTEPPGTGDQSDPRLRAPITSRLAEMPAERTRRGP